jgi:glycosyltransferase involved in cell wall biosynthesis
MPPFASVILPTLNRSSTLKYSLASVQNQTEKDLEILLVLDGATEACREIANAAAADDSRIVVLDLPKSHDQGAPSIDHAVRSARSERIFYIDDDDLWLPSHVAHLAPLLENADIADSRVCSLDRHGRLHLTPCAASNERMRRLLGRETRQKLIYDTHIAHRKDSYGVISHWLCNGPTKWAVWNFLIGFALDPACCWMSCEQVTAVSIHGAARRDFSPSERASEISLFFESLSDFDTALSEASVLFNLFRLLIVDAPRDESFVDYMLARGGYEIASSGGRERALFSLFTCFPPDRDVAVVLAGELAEPVESGYMFESIALAYFEAYGQDKHEEILLRSAAETGPNKAARLAAYSVALFRRDRPAACEIARNAIEIGPDPVGAIAHWLDRISQGG